MKLNEIFLTEKLIEVVDDVDRIYNHFFKNILDAVATKNIEEIQKQINISTVRTSTEELIKKGIIQNDILLDLHLKNPLSVLVNMVGGNAYSPLEKRLSLSINFNAFEILMNDMKGDLNNSHIVGDDAKRFESEFTLERIKGSIHHELAHWYDDTINNKHLDRKITKAMELGDRSILRLGKSDVNLTDFEIESQIHNIYQVYLHNKDEWDTMSFEDILDKSSPLKTLQARLSPEDYKYWKRRILKRMAREGLVGKKMRTGK